MLELKQGASSQCLLELLLLAPPLPAPPQSHFSRSGMNPDMAADMRAVVGKASRLLQAMVDVISSSGWLNPALAGAPPERTASHLPPARGCCRRRHRRSCGLTLSQVQPAACLTAKLHMLSPPQPWR